MNTVDFTEKSGILHKNNFYLEDVFSLIVFLLYLLVDFVPQFQCYNYAEPQWIYINVLNIAVLGCLIYSKKFTEFLLIQFFKNKIVLLYITFVLLCGLSCFVSLNKYESLIVIIRYVVAFIAFFNLYFSLRNKTHLFVSISILVSIVLFAECWKGLSLFFGSLGNINIETLRSVMTTNHANKNIFAANILVKIPFVFFAFTQTNSWKKIALFVTLLIAFLTIFFLSARAIMLGLFLVVFIIFIGFAYLTFIKKINKTKFLFLSTVILGLVAVFYLSVFIIKKNNFTLDKNGDKIKIENGSENRLNGISSKTQSLQIRLHYWKSSFEVIKKNPILGCGLGSWKIQSMPFENKWKQNNSNGIHMHNDFLEVTAETGILTGIVYVVLFCVLIYYNVRIFFTDTSEQKKIFSLFLTAAIIGYCVDSFLNFPLSQPTMQLVFVLIVVFPILNSINVLPEKKNLFKQSIFFPLILLLISVATIYPNYLMFEFYKGINITKIDNVALNLKFDQVNPMFNKFPNLDDTASPVEDIKTRYLIKENRFDEAIQLIEKSNKINPYSLYSNSLRVEMYDKMKMYDSVYKYNKILFESQPSYPVFYERYIISLARKKDTSAIQKIFQELKPEFKNAKHYAYTFSYLLNAGLAPKDSYKIIKQGLAVFPKDSLLNDIAKDFKRMLEVTNQKNTTITRSNAMDFDKALGFYLSEFNKNKTNFVNAENVGVCYYQQKKYDLALLYLQKVIDAKAFINGKSEYIAGLCYYYKNDFEKACKFANLSINQNYPDALQLKEISCK